VKVRRTEKIKSKLTPLRKLSLLRFRRLLIAGSVVTVFSFTIITGLGTNPASAAPSGTIDASPCLNFHNGPNGADTQIGCIPYGTVVAIACTSTGNSVTGPYGATTLWDQTTWNSQTGFVSDAWVYTGTANAVAASCSTPPPTTPTTQPQTNKHPSVNISLVPSYVGKCSGSNPAPNCNRYCPNDLCVTPGYNPGPSSQNAPGAQNWAWTLYGPSSSYVYGGYHNCTLYAAWILELEGVSPTGNLGNANQWHNRLSGTVLTNSSSPSVGDLAWFNQGQWGVTNPSGHIGYVAWVNSTKTEFLLLADNYGGGTQAAIVRTSQAGGFIVP